MFSLLNPDAPEFYPNLKEVTQNGFKSIQKSIQASNMFPSGFSHDNFKTVTDFNAISSQLCNNILQQSNEILESNTQVTKLKSNDEEHNTEKIIEANDNILDRTNTNIDIACGLRKPTNSISINEPKNPINHVSSWNSSPIISKIQMGSATLIGAKNIPRPQLKFKETVDNSLNLWVPKISDKPNSIKPLALKILYNDDGEAVGYEHPYQMELDLYHPPARLLEPDSQPPIFPAPLQDTPLTYIETEAQLDKLLEHLNEVDEFAVDVEHHSYRTYQGITCLLQISTAGGDFIIDALAVREHLHKLNLPFTSPNKLKVFHGADMDVVWLQRDFGVYIVGLFDTYQAAKLLKLTGLSLKNLLMRYCQVDADKKYQLADWRIRPLPEELLTYARVDTHYLLYTWRRMKGELLAAAGGGPRLLLAAFDQSKHICATTYNKPQLHEDSHAPLLARSKKSFNSRQMAALKLLYKWRDAQARELDESTAYLLPNHMLLSLAESLPREVQGVNACCSPMPPFVKQNLITVHRIILSCRELPLEPQLYQMPLSIRAMANLQRTSAHSFHDLSHFPDYRDDLPTTISIDSDYQNLYSFIEYHAEVEVFMPCYQTENIILSNLNVDAKSFIPPYERYKKYRSLAQIEEIKEFRQQEAKIAVLGKGDELIQNEVLLKMKEPESVRSESKPEAAKAHPAPAPAPVLPPAQPAPPAHRKRKISEKGVTKTSEIIMPERTDKLHNIVKTNEPQNKADSVKPYDYKTANYKKFYSEKKKLTNNKFQQRNNYNKKHKK